MHISSKAKLNGILQFRLFFVLLYEINRFLLANQCTFLSVSQIGFVPIAKKYVIHVCTSRCVELLVAVEICTNAFFFFEILYYWKIIEFFYRLFAALPRERNRILKILIASKIWSKNHLKRGRGCPPWRLGQSRFVRAIGKCIGLSVNICLFHPIILCFIEFLTLLYEKQLDLSNSM